MAAATEEDTYEDMRRNVFTVRTSSSPPPKDDRIRYGRIRATRQAIRHDVGRARTGEQIAIADEDARAGPCSSAHLLVVRLSTITGSTVRQHQRKAR